MLRFERKSRNRDVSISLRGKEKLFNSVFLTAIGTAIGLHALGLFIFHVTPFKLSMVNTVLPPVMVRADPSQKMVYTIAEEEPTLLRIDRPSFSRPTLPDIPKTKVSFDPGEP